LEAVDVEQEMRVNIESEWLRKNLYRWRGAIAVTDQIAFET
jgi:hypothetical protein